MPPRDDSQEAGGDSHAVVGQDYLPQRREILEPGAEELKCQYRLGVVGRKGPLGSNFRAVRLRPQDSNQTR